MVESIAISSKAVMTLQAHLSVFEDDPHAPYSGGICQICAFHSAYHLANSPTTLWVQPHYGELAYLIYPHSQAG
jgi:hypothetical protein